MTGFHIKDGVLHAENVSVLDIAQTYGTPTYVYSAAEIKGQYDALEQAMIHALPDGQKVKYCYACKANGNIAILAYLKSLGSALEVVSEGEIRRGLKAGFKGEDIVFTGVGKSVEEITFALRSKIYQFNIESLPELKRLQDVAASLDIQTDAVFRLNPGIEKAAAFEKTSTGGKRDKFGISERQVFEGYDLAKEMSHINLVGLSVHIGSQISKVEKFKEALEKMPELVGQLRDKGHNVTRLDIGGGFPIIYNDEDLLNLNSYAQWVCDFIAPLDVEIILEPGRYYVGNAGMLVTKVEYVKETLDHSYLVLDCAMNDLIRPAMYNAYHGIDPVTNHERPAKEYDVVGPVCESGDTFSKGRLIPEMKQDEFAVLRSAGAYGFCMASNYNARRLPAEVFVNGSNHSIIRPRQDFEDIMNMEAIPNWLT